MEISTQMQSSVVYSYNESLFNDLYNDYEMNNEGLMTESRPIVSLIIFSIVIVLSLIGNILVAVISVFCMRLQSLTSIFILNLALSDLLFTVGLVFRACDHIWGWTLGDAACKVANFISSAGFYSSIVFLALMSVQRYMAVVHPLSAWKKRRCFTLVLACAWMVSILTSVPGTVHIVEPYYLGHCMYSSNTAFVAITHEENIVFVCSFLVMAFCYIRILQTIFKSPTNQSHRITGLVFFLVATFYICWTPYNILIFLVSLIHYQIMFSTQVLDHLDYAYYICQFLAFTRCCLNPVIYGLFGLIFRKTAQEIFLQGELLQALHKWQLEKVILAVINLNKSQSWT